MNEAYADLSILWPAFVAGVLVLLSHVPLGQQVLKRGIVFIDLAIAQVAGLGVIAAHAAGMELQDWQTQVAAVVAALLGAVLLNWTDRKRPEVQEAVIGVLFVLASTAQILLLANDPHGGEALKDLLAGQILWVSNEHLIRAAVVTAVFLFVWFRFRERIGTIGLLRALRARRHDVGATRRCVPRVHDLDRAGARNVPARAIAATLARVRGGFRQLCGGPGGVPGHGPALGRRDRVGHGDARHPHAPDRK